MKFFKNYSGVDLERILFFYKKWNWEEIFFLCKKRKYRNKRFKLFKEFWKFLNINKIFNKKYDFEFFENKKTRDFFFKSFIWICDLDKAEKIYFFLKENKIKFFSKEQLLVLKKQYMFYSFLLDEFVYKRGIMSLSDKEIAQATDETLFYFVTDYLSIYGIYIPLTLILLAIGIYFYLKIVAGDSGSSGSSGSFKDSSRTGGDDPYDLD